MPGNPVQPCRTLLAALCPDHHPDQFVGAVRTRDPSSWRDWPVRRGGLKRAAIRGPISGSNACPTSYRHRHDAFEQESAERLPSLGDSGASLPARPQRSWCSAVLARDHLAVALLRPGDQGRSDPTDSDWPVTARIGSPRRLIVHRLQPVLRALVPVDPGKHVWGAGEPAIVRQVVGKIGKLD